MKPGGSSSPAGPPSLATSGARGIGRGRLVLLLLAAQLLSLIEYWPSLHGELVFDDHPLLVENDCHRSLRRIPSLLTGRANGVCGVRPLRFVSFAVDHAIWGDRVLGYHLTNVLLHGLVAWLVLLWLLRLTRDLRLAAIAAGFFLLHPIATEAVAYVSGRRDLLMALGALLAALLYESYRERGALWRLLLFLLALLGALFSHETAAAVPAALLVLEVCRRWPAIAPRRRALLAALRGLWAPRVRSALAAGLALAGGFSLWTMAAHNFSERTSLWGPTVPAHAATVLRVHAHYLRQLVAPTNLCADYSDFPVSASALEPAGLGALVLVGGLLVLAWLCLPRWPLLAAAILGYFTLLLPVSQIVIHHELLAEHRLYLPALCWCAVLAAGGRIAVTRSRWAWGLLVALGLAGIALTLDRSTDWSSSERLWSVTAAQVPGSARAQLNLGVALARKSRLGEARPRLEASLAIDPGLCDARYNYGALLLNLGEPARGLDELRAAVACKPRPRYLRALGMAALQHGSVDEAEASFRSALIARPDDPMLRFGLGRALERRDLLGAAERELRLALGRRAGWPPALRALARVLAASCRPDEAAGVLRELGAVAPGSWLARKADAEVATAVHRCRAAH